MATRARSFSVRLVLSYVIDWIIIIAIAAVGAAFSAITPNRRPFDITNPDISYPNVKEKVSTGLLVVIGLIIPGVIVFLVCLFIGLGPSTSKPSSKTKLLKRKLWELNAGWMGLALSLAVAFFISDGIKNLVGKPRPNLLARCDPDISRLVSSAVGGIGNVENEGIKLVSWTICRNTGDILDEGFRAFPSGHSTFSFAGLTYLTLFLCAKLAITIPFLNYHNISSGSTSLRRQAAAAPIYLLIFPLLPIGLATYVATTRYSDFEHHGWDIIAGAILGVASAWLGFRWYHLPINRGGGWAWAPRSPDRAFGRGIGHLTYINNETSRNAHPMDIENAPHGAGNIGGTSTIGPYKTSNGSEGVHLNDYPGTAAGSDSSQRPLR